MSCLRAMSVCPFVGHRRTSVQEPSLFTPHFHKLSVYFLNFSHFYWIDTYVHIISFRMGGKFGLKEEPLERVFILTGFIMSRRVQGWPSLGLYCFFYFFKSKNVNHFPQNRQRERKHFNSALSMFQLTSLLK